MTGTTHKLVLRIGADLYTEAQGFVRTWDGFRTIEVPFIPRRGMRLRGFIGLPEVCPDELEPDEQARWFRANFHAVMFGAHEHNDSEEQGWGFDDPPVWNVATGRFEVFVSAFSVGAPEGTTTQSLRQQFPEWDWVPSVAE